MPPRACGRGLHSAAHCTHTHTHTRTRPPGPRHLRTTPHPAAAPPSRGRLPCVTGTSSAHADRASPLRLRPQASTQQAPGPHSTGQPQQNTRALYSWKGAKHTTELWPPKPNELEMAAVICVRVAFLHTRVRNGRGLLAKGTVELGLGTQGTQAEAGWLLPSGEVQCITRLAPRVNHHVLHRR